MIELDSSEMVEEEIIGHGQFGVVVKCSLKKTG
jgi:hypothetical protein